LILAPLANKAVKFKSEDFRLVQMIGVSPMGIVARKSLPASNVDELIALARKADRDGKPLSYASVGIGSFYHVLGEHFSQTIQAQMVHVPYKGAAPIFQDLGGDMVDFAIFVTGAQINGLADTGRLKVLGTLAPAGQVEAPFLKAYPSVNDSQQLKNFAFNIWTGYFVRKDTPEAVVEALQKAITATLNDPAVRSQLEQQAVMPAAALSLAVPPKSTRHKPPVFGALPPPSSWKPSDVQHSGSGAGPAWGLAGPSVAGCTASPRRRLHRRAPRFAPAPRTGI
jgi:tripartite-type tricarboxylate transporter receptor subunit TctC